MKKLFFGLLLLAYSASPCLGASLQLSILNGRVSIDAQDVTIRQILTEWSRVGQTRIVNLERLAGSAITIKFEGVPERQALDIILRNVPGYIAAPRATLVANASIYDTILIMATTTAVAALRPPNTAYPGLPRPGGNVTQLRQSVPLTPGVLPDPPADPAADQQDDPAIAAAAAAGLITVPAPMPGPSMPPGPLMMPGGAAQSPPAPAAPAPTPANPWGAPIGTPLPSLAPPPAPAPTQPTLRPRPPQADR